MLRTFAKWLIARASEREAPLPPWLRRRVDSDEELARFETASRQLGSLLRRDAADWMARQTRELRPALVTRKPVRPVMQAVNGPRRRIAWSLAAGGLAVVALFVVLTWAPGRDAALVESPEDGGPVPGRIARTIDPNERQQLAAAWRAGRESLEGWQSHVTVFTGRIAATHLSSAAAQRKELAAGVTSAYRFFTLRLPASVAQLVGLQDG